MNCKNLLRNIVKEKSGFSVVEMMLAIVIAGILVGAIGGFLMMHIKSFETTKSVVDTQLEGQIAINTFGKVAMEAQSIELLLDESDVDQKGTNVEIINPKRIVFKSLDDAGHDEYFVLTYIPLEDKLVFKQTSDSTYVLGTEYDFAYYIKDWKLSPGIGGKNYGETDNIYITVNMSTGGAEVELSNLFKLRNKR